MQQYDFITADTLITTAKAEAISSTSSSITALQDEQLLAKVHQLNAEWINAAHISPLGGWSWMQRIYNFKSVAHTTLNGATSANAATFVLTSASDFDSSGRVAIETSKNAIDFVDYSSKSTNTLTVSTATGAETLEIAHSSGDRVEKMYALPSDYSKAKYLYINGVQYDYERLDGWPIGFTTYGNYTLLPRGIGACDCTLSYFKKGTTIDKLTGTTDIPSIFERWAVEKLKAHIYLIRRKRADVPTALQLAQEALSYAIAHDSQQISNSEASRLELPY